MPRRDGTGPMGNGAMSGRGLGFCSGVDAPIYGGGWGQGCRRGQGSRAGRGMGQGLGMGFGIRNQAGSKEVLLAQKERLQNMLGAIDEQIEKL